MIKEIKNPNIAMHRKIGLVTVYAKAHKLRQKAARYPHPSEHGGVRFPVMAGVGFCDNRFFQFVRVDSFIDCEVVIS